MIMYSVCMLYVRYIHSVHIYCRVMRTFDQSSKSQKTVASLIIDPKKKQDSSHSKSAKGKENKTPTAVSKFAGSQSGEWSHHLTTCGHVANARISARPSVLCLVEGRGEGV